MGLKQRKPFTRQDIHISFQPHTPNTKYMPQKPRKNTRTLVVERASGNFSKFIDINEIKYGKYSEIRNPYDESEQKYLVEAIQAGKKVTAGEFARNHEEQYLLDTKGLALNDAFTIAVTTPTMGAFKEMTAKLVEFNNFRHQLIRRTLKEQSLHPIEARFGAMHSTLSRELAREGIRTSRDIHKEFKWDEVIARRIMYGLPVSELDYKRGLVAWICKVRQGHTTQKDYERAQTNMAGGKGKRENYLRATRVQNALINRLTEEQINHIIETQNPWVLFYMNGLKAPPTRKEIDTFLAKHSFEYRREQAAKNARKMKGTAAIIKNPSGSKTITTKIHTHPGSRGFFSFNDISSFLNAVSKNKVSRYSVIVAHNDEGEVTGYTSLRYGGPISKAKEIGRMLKREYSSMIQKIVSEREKHPEKFAHITPGKPLISSTEEVQFFMDFFKRSGMRIRFVPMKGYKYDPQTRRYKKITKFLNIIQKPI